MPDDIISEQKEFDLRHKQGRGPSSTGTHHMFCPTCNRPMYSVWTYGPVVPAVYNTTYCVCDGRWEGWDAADIARNKEHRDRVEGSK